jgi:bacillithiol system protein YtxJ
MYLIRMDAHRVLDEAIDRSYAEPVVIYKHSATCSLSFVARQEMIRLMQDGPAVYEVIVQYDRPLSNAIAEAYEVRHESPQVIVLHQNRPVFDASHRRVTAEGVRAVINGIARPEAA